ncbi:sulfotransferase family protein [Cognatiluteimonas lumbrici]|uniref:sulfotransferase n=1 Tax=Cognatiluteimonas lumbrici TaxID=2559601 RepID=UPI00112D5D32|nr:sulfotransferase [Luteimonas lumbrici]
MSRLPVPRSATRAANKLAEILQESVDLLDDAELLELEGEALAEPEPSLVQQCVELAEAGAMAEDEPIRTLHHFACTGGTVISKCVAAMPNVQLLSELDPLSPMASAPGAFAPTDMSMLLKHSTRPPPKETLLELFRAQLDVAYRSTLSQGGYLVVRDHTHSHFCTGSAVPERPSVRELVAMVAPVSSLVTVRNPIDSFVSLRLNKWVKFEPATFDEYCSRYLAFLDRYEGVPIMRYEDFIQDPKREMQEACRHLQLPYFDEFASVFSVFRVSGDSGRHFAVLSSPPPRPERDHLLKEAIASSCYRRLADRLGYPVEGA